MRRREAVMGVPLRKPAAHATPRDTSPPEALVRAGALCFPAVALLLGLIEVLSHARFPSLGPLTPLVPVALLALALVGVFPRAAGWCYCVIALVLLLAPPDLVLATATPFGLTVLLVVWAFLGRRAETGVCLALLIGAEGVLLWGYESSFVTVGTYVGMSVVSVPIGVVLRRATLREAQARDREVQARAHAEELREELLDLLHDEVASRLVRVASNADVLAARVTDTTERARVRAIGREAREAMAALRTAMAPGGTPVEDASVADTVERHRELLAARGVDLRVTPCDLRGFESDLTTRERLLLDLCVREACTNVWKHAAAGECVLDFALDPDDGLTFTAHNRVRSGGRPPVGSSGRGVAMVERRVHAAGGRVNAFAEGGAWIFAVVLPRACEEVRAGDENPPR